MAGLRYRKRGCGFKAARKQAQVEERNRAQTGRQTAGEERTMNLPRAKFVSTLGAVALLAAIAAPAVRGQTAPPAQPAGAAESVNQMQNQLHYLTDVQRQSSVDPSQKRAYDKFYKAGSAEPDKKIQLGTEFLRKYPQSPFTEAVDAGLTNAYFEKHDWNDFFSYADKTLAMDPDEVDVLTSVGWVIPHQINPGDPDAAQRLNVAEADEKHALDLLSKMQKPKSLSDEQFAADKAQKALQAHSALGLIYFRRGDYANSVTELQQATQGTSGVDETDVFVLGVDLQQLNRHSEAASAFLRCSETAGALQDRCKQSAADEAKLAHGGK
jgi:tetratricopeptide (TPR) repeat protein